MMDMFNLKAVLFDLDGTLLPLEQDGFIDAYFRHLASCMGARGYDPDKLVKAVWAGTHAMMKNDGHATNETVFWESFRPFCEKKEEACFSDLDHFYAVDFDTLQAYTGFNPLAREAVCTAKSLGLRVVVATNPVFPACALHKRIRWAGLEPEDFDLVTTYENSRFSKPSAAYYRDILTYLGLPAESCLMVGNDVIDDMSAAELGMDTFLLTDCLVNRENRDITPYRRGGFGDLIRYLKGEAPMAF